MLPPSRARRGCTTNWHGNGEPARQHGENADQSAWCVACTTPARDPRRVVSLDSKDGSMEGLRWWLLLLTAIMFSMSR
jgi:hypothetical protein